MPDINKFIRGQAPDEVDGVEMEEWNDAIAQQHAAAEGIELTEEHWIVLHYLRKYFREQEQPVVEHHMSEALNVAFECQGGSKYLYRLFPNGPVRQGGRIAGLPIPEHPDDKGFGFTR